MKHERKCIVCGKTYEYCPRCKQYASSPKWKINFCSEDCKNIFEVIDKFIFKHISAEDAKKELNNTKVVINNDELKKVVNSIMVSEDNKDKEEKRKKRKDEIVNED